jgi:quercetin dioxygenase-like cupin family protein
MASRNFSDRAKKVEKPWGYELIWAHTERYVGKILHINKGESLSYQYHRVKDETIYLMGGLMELEIGDERRRKTQRLEPGASLHIAPGTRHRMTALEDCEVLEVSTPELEDVVRLEDRYGRVGPEK